MRLDETSMMAIHLPVEPSVKEESQTISKEKGDNLEEEWNKEYIKNILPRPGEDSNRLI
jgi:hypothetical protein